jgi:ribosome maturation factor RimP
MKNFTNIKTKVEKLINEILQKHHLQIYEINNFSEFGDDVFQVLVEDQTKTNQPLDFDTLVVVNEEISNLLDQIPELESHYLLEVASAGIEKRIRNEQELIKAVESYLYLELEKLGVIEGYLKAYDPATQEFRVEYFVKGQPKKVQFN